MLKKTGGSPCILIVEDHVKSLNALCRLLRQEGYDCRGVGSCAAALAAHLDSPCGVLVCDLDLPDGDGISLLKKIRAAPGGRGVCGIAFTGRVGASEEAEARAAGFTEFVEKPARFETLQAAINESCGLRPRASA